MPEKKKSLLDKAIDAVTSRDEKQEAEEAKRAADAARAQAAREKAAAEAQARAAEARAKAAEERAKTAEKAAAEARAQAARKEAEERVKEIREQVELRKAEAAAAAKRTYVVKSGDSLSKIARDQLGDASRWPEIFELNKDKIKDPNLIYPGQELTLPK
jgi:nucleoid-associated protein YgaU